MSSIATSLLSTYKDIIRYGFPIFLVLGNVGNLSIIIIFSQKHHRQSSCSLYLLAAAFFSIVGLNWGFGSSLYSLHNPPDPFAAYVFLCRFRAYILLVSSFLYKTMILLATADRFALTSNQPGIRAFGKPKMALKMIVGMTLFGMIISVHVPILGTIENSVCGVFGTYGFFFSIYMIGIFGLILPISTLVFGCLVLKNLKTARVRVQPIVGTDNNTSQNVLTRRDVNLIKLVFAEILIGIILTSLYPISLLYIMLASNVPNKTLDRIVIESFTLFLTLTVLFYSNYCATFYLYITVSSVFRQEIKRFILKYVKRTNREQNNTNPVSLNKKRRTDQHTDH